MKSVDVYRMWVWDCPVCDFTNIILDHEAFNIKGVSCFRCKRKYDVDHFYEGEKGVNKDGINR